MSPSISNLSDNDEPQEYFVGDAEGNIDGEVVDDIEGQQDMIEDDDVDDQNNDHGDGDGPSMQDDSFHTFEGHQDPVLAVAWSPAADGTVATGGQDDKGFIWKVYDGGSNVDGLGAKALSGHSDSVVDVKFNANGNLLATAGMDGTVKVWSVPDGTLLHSLDGPGDSVEWIKWHPRGDVILGGSADFSVWMWNAQTGVCMQVFTGHRGSVSCGSFTPDGRVAVTGGGEGDPSVRVWNPKDGQCTATVEGHGFHEDGLTCLEVQKDGLVALSGSVDGTARLCNIQSGKPAGTLSGHEDSVECVTFATTLLPLMLTASMDGKVMSWDTASLTRRQTFQHPEGVVALECVPDAPVFVTGCLDGVVRAWDARTAACVQELHGFSEGVQCLKLSPNGKFALAGSDDKTVRVFELGQSGS